MRVYIFLTQVLLWFCFELPLKGSAKGGRIRDARVKAQPVNWLTPDTQDPETQPQFAHSGGRRERKLAKDAESLAFMLLVKCLEGTVHFGGPV